MQAGVTACSKFFHGPWMMNAHRQPSWRFLNRCKGWIERHPVAANSLLSLNLWIAGDLLAQYSEHRFLQRARGKDKDDGDGDLLWDFRRTSQCALYGACFTGPVMAIWYPFLDRICVSYRLSARYGLWAAPIAKVLVDEFVMDPPCLVAFFGYMNFCEGGDLASLQNKLNGELLRSWLAGFAFWPVVCLGAFRYLPGYAQAPMINTCGIVWDGFLSHRNFISRLKEEAEQRPKAENS